VTNVLTDSHAGVERGLMGAVMAEIGPADLHLMEDSQ
jgi:hypothetical protein